VRIDMYSVGRQPAVPGKVVEGMDVLDRYQDVPVDGEAPKERIELKSVRIAMIAK
jgi:cyclophilin family peptidyl-prolyl cis-trans isomerase